MLQRIQSVYLLLIICCCIVLSVIPLFQVHAADGVYELSIIKTSFIRPNDTSVLNYNFPLIIINFLIAIFALVTTFRYKNRQIQLKLINIIFILILIFTGVLFFDYRQIVSLSDSSNANALSWLVIIVP